MKRYIILILLIFSFLFCFSQKYFSYSQSIGTIENNSIIDYQTVTLSYRITIDSLYIELKDLEHNEIVFSNTFQKIESNEFGDYYKMNSKITPYFFHSKKGKYITMYIPDGILTHYISMDYN